MFDQVSVIVMEVRLSPRIKKHVAARTAACKCLQCDQPTYRRGLCTSHYSQFRTALQELPKKERQVLECKLIEKGEVAEDRQGQRLHSVNVFRQLAEMA